MWASTPTNPNYNISGIVRSIKTLTTKEVGKPIFQRSYYDHVIRNQKDYDEVWEYIENNPRKLYKCPADARKAQREDTGQESETMQ